MNDTNVYPTQAVVTGTTKEGTVVTGKYVGQGRIFPETHVLSVNNLPVVVVGAVTVVTK